MVGLLVSFLISGDFVPYTNSFIKDSGGLLRPSDLDGAEIVFKKLEYQPHEGGVIGYCYVPEIKIEIDPEWWAESDEVDRWQLMYHELGHCLCGLEHTSQPVGDGFISFLERRGIKTNRQDYLPGKCPKSVMDPFTLERECVVRHREHYVKEVFEKCKSR